MTLTALLEIDRTMLLPEEQRAILLAELIWREAASPIEPQSLCRTLELILGACYREGLRYPPILLRRKKELQRGSWAPQARAEALRASASQRDAFRQRTAVEIDDAAAAMANAESTDGAVCMRCGGSGVIANPGGLSGRLCDCYLRKIGQKTNAPTTCG